MAKDKYRLANEMNYRPLLHFHDVLTKAESGLDIINLNNENTEIDKDDDTYCLFSGKDGLQYSDMELVKIINYFPDLQFYSKNEIEKPEEFKITCVSGETDKFEFKGNDI